MFIIYKLLFLQLIEKDWEKIIKLRCIIKCYIHGFLQAEEILTNRLSNSLVPQQYIPISWAKRGKNVRGNEMLP